jgi:flagellar motor switch protein FliN/FliY
MLSQDEINALLNGIDSGEIDINEAAAQAAEQDAKRQEEINNFQHAEATEDAALNEAERDAVGEIANICMGSAATTLFSLVNRKVNITTPVVSLARWENVLEDYEKPCVFIQIKYTAGLDGHNILVLKEHDVKVITNLMMGGDGTDLDNEELGELHLSAISEAMNQMMGASATSLSTMLGKLIDISPPEASQIDLTAVKDGTDIAPFLGGTFVKIKFRMQIDDDLVDSTLMQLYPVDFAKFLSEKFMASMMGSVEESAPAAAPEPAPAPAPAPAAPDMGQQPMMQQPMPDMSGVQGMQGMPQGGMPMGGYPQMGMPQGGMPMMGYPQMVMPMQTMNIQPAQFQAFAAGGAPGGDSANIDLIMDVPLEVTVELGRTKKLISEILDFAPGTILELEKIAGEPVDVLVNGKLVAKGEVVVIEESFGVRVTDIVK